MFLSRKIGSVLRGKATPPQVMMATILAGMLGFVPGFFLVKDLGGGFLQAPGLILALLFLVLILNANLAVFGLALLVSKLCSLLLVPLSFTVGRWLLDGPLQGLFAWAVNAPVLAWFGLERYATTGGLLVGLLFGIGLGLLTLRGLRTFRARMAEAEENSERYQKWSRRRSARVLAWVFLGKGKGKRTYRELLESDKKGLPVRITGLLAVVLVGVGLWLGNAWLGGTGLRNALRSGLEQWNGATVDLAEAGVDLAAGRATFRGLAVADPEQLDQDHFRARSLEMRLGTSDLLSKRLVIDSIVSSEAQSGTRREVPGVRIAEDEPPPPPPAGEGKTLDDYLKEARVWQERLQKVGEWLEKVAGGDEVSDEASQEERDRRIREQAERLGRIQVVADHLLREAPLVLVRNVVLDGVTVASLGEDLLDIKATNLSSQPSLVDGPIGIRIASRSGVFAFSFEVAPGKPQAARTAFTWKGLPVDTVAGQLAAAPIQGGTVDLGLEGVLDCGSADGVRVDVPLRVTLRNTTLSLPGLPPTAVEQFTLPVGLRGPLAAPRVTIDDQQVVDALVQAGRQELANQFKVRAAALLDGKLPGVVDQVGGVLDGSKTPQDVLDAAKKKAEAEAQKARDAAAEAARKKAEEEAKKLLPGGLPGGLFGGKKG